VFRGTNNTPACRASVENCPRPLEHRLEIQIKYTGRSEEEPHYQATYNHPDANPFERVYFKHFAQVTYRSSMSNVQISLHLSSEYLTKNHDRAPGHAGTPCHHRSEET